MTMWFKHVHRLELQKVFIFCAAYFPGNMVKRDIETKLLYFVFWTCMSEIRKQEFRLYI